MLKSLLRFTLFSIGIALMIELSLRIVFFGADAFRPAMMNSYTVIQDSGLVQRAANTDVYYELKPNLDGLLSGTPVVTNSSGLPDKEYSLAKPENVYRIVIVGSSWSMATSVAMDDNYQANLERELGDIIQGKQVEVINFSVEYYGLGEIIATTKYKALEYDPDMIILPLTATTPSILWIDEKEPFEPSEVTPPFYQSYLYSTVMGLTGKRAYSKTMRPQVELNRGGYMRQIRRAMAELRELVNGKNIDVTVLWLTYLKKNELMLESSQAYATEMGFKFVPIHLDDLAGPGAGTTEFMNGEYGRHPNEFGHKLISDEILRQVWIQ